MSIPHENSESKSASPTLPVLIPRPDGRGALLSGGMPGNRGGTGRPPDSWKQRMANALERSKAPEVIEKIISGDILEHLGDSEAGPIIGETRNGDRLKAIEFATAYGHGKPDQHIEADLTIRIARDEPTDG